MPFRARKNDILLLMKTAFVAVLLFLSSILTQAEPTERGVIDDPDGFTNVRAERRENAAIVARVNTGEIFDYDRMEKETWWKVKLASGKTGWMHYSRIRMFVVPEDLVVAENDEAVTYARDHGADYLKLLRGAVKGERAAMQEFFGLGSDGAAYETHVHVIIKLIHILGDDKLSKFLSRQSPDYKKRVAQYVTDDNGLPPFEPVSYMKRHFPKTARLLFPR